MLKYIKLFVVCLCFLTMMSELIFGKTYGKHGKQQPKNPYHAGYVVGKSYGKQGKQQQPKNPYHEGYVVGKSYGKQGKQQQPKNPYHAGYVVGKSYGKQRKQQQNPYHEGYVVGKSYGKQGKQQQPKNPYHEAKVYGKSHGKYVYGYSPYDDADGSCAVNGQCKNNCDFCESNATDINVPCSDDLVCCEIFESTCPGTCVQDCCGLTLPDVGCCNGTICCVSRNESINENFYPFGVNAGDTCWTGIDDGATAAILTDGIPFYGSLYTSLYIGSNGYITFDSSSTSFSAPNLPAIFVFLKDLSFTGVSDAFLWYRVAGSSILDQISSDIQTSFTGTSFSPTFGLVATFDRVRLFGNPFSERNTFQCVLATDGTSTFAILVYDEIIFSANSVGFNMPGLPFFSLPSVTSTLTTLSNVGTAGKFVFKIDADPIEEP